MLNKNLWLESIISHFHKTHTTLTGLKTAKKQVAGKRSEECINDTNICLHSKNLLDKLIKPKKIHKLKPNSFEMRF